MKAVLTFEDNADGTLQMSVEFDPPVTDDSKITPAGSAALKCMRLIAGKSVTEDDEDDDDEKDED